MASTGSIKVLMANICGTPLVPGTFILMYGMGRLAYIGDPSLRQSVLETDYPKAEMLLSLTWSLMPSFSLGH